MASVRVSLKLLKRELKTFPSGNNVLVCVFFRLICTVSFFYLRVFFSFHVAGPLWAIVLIQRVSDSSSSYSTIKPRPGGEPVTIHSCFKVQNYICRCHEKGQIIIFLCKKVGRLYN